MKPPIIGLAGKAGAGKDTLAALLVEHHGYTRRAFADALKIAWLDTAHRDLCFTSDAQAIAYVNRRKAAEPEVRSELQQLGQSRRDANPNCWVDALFNWWHSPIFRRDEQATGLVIPDVRYLNEVYAIHDRGGVVVCVVREGHDSGLTPEQRAHPSETELDDHAGMEFIFNDGTPQDMLDQLREIIDLG